MSRFILSSPSVWTQKQCSNYSPAICKVRTQGLAPAHRSLKKLKLLFSSKKIREYKLFSLLMKIFPCKSTVLSILSQQQATSRSQLNECSTCQLPQWKHLLEVYGTFWSCKYLLLGKEQDNPQHYTCSSTIFEVSYAFWING